MTHQPNRTSIRRENWDYTSPGAYYVTICTNQRRPLFAQAQDVDKQLTFAGILATACWLALPWHFPTVRLDEFTIMPDHVHGILVLIEGPRWFGTDPTNAPGPPPGPLSGSIGAIVGSYKAAVTKWVHRTASDERSRHAPIWQRNFHDRIIRDDREFDAKRRYTIDNWNRWVAKRPH